MTDIQAKIDRGAGINSTPHSAEDFDSNNPWAMIALPAQAEDRTAGDAVPFDIIAGLKSDFLMWCAALGVTDRDVLGRVFDTVCAFEPEKILQSDLVSLQQSFGILVSTGLSATNKVAFIQLSNFNSLPSLQLSFHVSGQVITPPPITQLAIPDNININDTATLDALDAAVIGSTLREAKFRRTQRGAQLSVWIEPQIGDSVSRSNSFLEILRVSGCTSTAGGEESSWESLSAPALSSGKIMVYRFKYRPFQ